MEALPEEPHSMNAQLRQLPAYQDLLAPAPESLPMTASRVVAALMQLKDTVNILLLLSNGALLVGIFCGFGVPGLVLYGLRWRQVRGRASRGAIIWQGGLSLLHELFWASLFHNERTANEPLEYCGVLTVLYAIGALLSAVQLLMALAGTTEEYKSSTSLSAEQLPE